MASAAPDNTEATLVDGDFANTYCCICRKDAVDSTGRLLVDLFCITSCYHVLCLDCFIGNSGTLPDQIKACSKCGTQDIQFAILSCGLPSSIAILFKPLDAALKDYEAALEYQKANLEDQVRFLKKTCLQQRGMLQKQKAELDSFKLQNALVDNLKAQILRLTTDLSAARRQNGVPQPRQRPITDNHDGQTFASLKRKTPLHPESRPLTANDFRGSKTTPAAAIPPSPSVTEHLQRFEYQSNARTHRISSPPGPSHRITQRRMQGSANLTPRKMSTASLRDPIHAPMPLRGFPSLDANRPQTSHGDLRPERGGVHRVRAGEHFGQSAASDTSRNSYRQNFQYRQPN